MFTRNVKWTMILNFIVSTFLKNKTKQVRCNFNNRFYLTQYIWNTITSTCTQYSKICSWDIYIFIFILSLQSLVCILYSQQTWIRTTTFQVPQSHTWCGQWLTAQLQQCYQPFGLGTQTKVLLPNAIHANRMRLSLVKQGGNFILWSRNGEGWAHVVTAPSPWLGRSLLYL